MKTLVKTTNETIFEVKDYFFTSKGAYEGKVIIKNQEINTYWFFSNNKISFLTDPFVIDGVQYRAKGEVIQMSSKLEDYLSNKIKKEAKNKKEAKSEYLAQMYNN